MPCLIIGNHTQGLGIVRCLAAAGLASHVVNGRVVSISRFSRYLKEYQKVKRGTMQEIYQPGPAAELLAAIARIVPAGGR